MKVNSGEIKKRVEGCEKRNFGKRTNIFTSMSAKFSGFDFNYNGSFPAFYRLGSCGIVFDVIIGQTTRENSKTQQPYWKFLAHYWVSLIF